ncbi:MAG: hypothetical protein M0P13_09065, partial [Fibrobacteraceae bacterium]|nr:hypothetical protein [Fibrobacteraceae bacterium]
FKLIDDTMQKNILVPYGEGANWIDSLKRQGPERWLLRKLQRYMVNIYTPDFDALLHRGSIAEISPGIYALLCPIEYDQKTGLKVDDVETEILML